MKGIVKVYDFHRVLVEVFKLVKDVMGRVQLLRQLRQHARRNLLDECLYFHNRNQLGGFQLKEDVSMFVNRENQGLGWFVIKEIRQCIRSLTFGAVFLYHLTRHCRCFLSLETEAVTKETIHVVLLPRPGQFHKGIHHVRLYHFKYHLGRKPKGL